MVRFYEFAILAYWVDSTIIILPFEFRSIQDHDYNNHGHKFTYISTNLVFWQRLLGV